MSASKTPLVLLPAALAVALAVPTPAKAQQKTASVPAKSAALTTPAQPPTTIAPRQSLPAFTSVKATLSPVLATPTANTPTAKGKAITPPMVKPPVKAAALPKSTPTSAASLSARERAPLGTPAPVSAIPSIVRGRRAFGAAVSLSTSPVRPVALTRRATIAPAAPIVSAPVRVKAIEPLPKINVSAPVATDAVIGARRPAALSSREAKAREIALARLDAQLAGAEGRLNRAQTKLTEGQRQLGNVNNLLQNAMLSSGGSGLHPFVRVAQRYLGTPYVWGGESARGFDCSGFIMRVMRDLGYKALPHSAAEQFNYGKPVAKNLLQPGDIVFFANTYKPGISHVGIYLGGGRFIHAANSQVGTIVSNLNSAKWTAHYAGARRLMKMN